MDIVKVREDQSPLKRFSCKICSKTFGRKDNVKRHMQLKHKDLVLEAEEIQGATSCLYPKCSLKFYHTTKLLKHVREDHQMTFEVEDLKFNSHDEFLRWKQKEEIENFVYFSKSNGPRQGKVASYEYYKCQRDGSSRPHKKAGEPGRRTARRNSKGVAKTGIMCPARLQVRMDSSGVMMVRYYKTHTHPISFEDTIHHPISSALREEIKYRTLLGFSAEEIQSDLREGVWNRRNGDSGTVSKERQLVSKRFIDTVRRSLSVTRTKGGCSESPMDRRILSLQKEKYNPLLFYKPSGRTINTIYSLQDLPVLPLGTLAVGLQSVDQGDLLRTCGTHLLYIDRNHCESDGQIIVLVLMTIDEYENGFIVASLITNDFSSEVLTVFFRCLNEKAERKLHFSTVLSCDDKVVTISLRNVFGSNIFVLPCKWHLFKRWLKSIGEEFRCYEDKRDAFIVLVSAFAELAPEEYQTLLSNLATKWSVSHASFVQLCGDQLFPECLQLATFHRNYAVADHYISAFLATFHARVHPPSCTAADGKQMDSILTLLLSMEDNDYARRQKSFSTIDHQFTSSSSKHDASLRIADASVWSASDTRWFVESDSQRPQPYLVTNNTDYCEAEDCFVTCLLPPCYSLCGHMYLCTCEDSTSLCVHVHKVHSMRYKAFRSQALRDLRTDIQVVDRNSLGNVSTVGLHSSSSSQLNALKGDWGRLDISERVKLNLDKITALLNDQSASYELLCNVDSVLQQLVQNAGL